MTLTARLSRAEEHFADAGDVGFGQEDLEVLAAKWDDILLPVAAGLDREAAERLVEVAEETFESIFHLTRQGEERREFTLERTTDELVTRQRWAKAASVFLNAVPAKLKDRVVLAGVIPSKPRRWLDHGQGWAADWLFDLCQLSCRTPPDVREGAIVTLIDFYLNLPAHMTGLFHSCCPECGLRVPTMAYDTGQGRYRSCDALQGCPHCGVDQRQLWPIGRIGEKSFPWIALAEEELAF
jgi:hypothetical protein